MLLKTALLISASLLLIAILIIIKKYPFVLVIGLCLMGGDYIYTHPSANSFASSTDKPNIIIIGLDSIRPDHIGYYGNKNIKTPNIDQFLANSANFTQAYSALARTYVAWNSILTGEYPKNDKVRDNLIDPVTLNLSNTLVTHLKKAGYETMFATDSRQFSLINKHFGFDKIISPNMGIYDFVFSIVNDFPLSNLIMNSALGAWLFPYNYGNRMAYVTYEPQTFVRMLNKSLANRKNKPLLLGIHMILSHWPYMWAQDGQDKKLTKTQKYNNMLEAIDRQFAAILTTLQKNNLLQHAIVVLLSDHGISLGLHGDRIIAKRNYVGTKSKLPWLKSYPYFDTSEGEGIDILSFNSSNHIIFGIRTYGEPYGVIKDNAYPVNLIDIAPTILDLLDVDPLSKADGISLKPFITHNITLSSTFPSYPRTRVSKKSKINLDSRWCGNDGERPLFFETGIWMPLITIEDIKQGLVNKYLKQKLNDLYGYNPKDNLLIMKASAIRDFLTTKQRGLLYGNWFLARYPKSSDYDTKIISPKEVKKHHCDFTKSNGDGKIICYTTTKIPKPFYVLVNTKTGQWTMNLHSAFAKPAPINLLMKKFISFYGIELPIIRSTDRIN
jgi:hypothetical protein